MLKGRGLKSGLLFRSEAFGEWLQRAAKGSSKPGGKLAVGKVGFLVHDRSGKRWNDCLDQLPERQAGRLGTLRQQQPAQRHTDPITVGVRRCLELFCAQQPELGADDRPQGILGDFSVKTGVRTTSSA